MFDFICEMGNNELLFAEGAGFMGALEVSFQKLHFLGDISAFLVILVIAMDVGKESPVIKVIDCIFEEGVSCLVAPEAMTDPGGEGLHQFVSGIIGRHI